MNLCKIFFKDASDTPNLLLVVNLNFIYFFIAQILFAFVILISIFNFIFIIVYFM